MCLFVCRFLRFLCLTFPDECCQICLSVSTLDPDEFDFIGAAYADQPLDDVLPVKCSTAGCNRRVCAECACLVEREVYTCPMCVSTHPDFKSNRRVNLIERGSGPCFMRDQDYRDKAPRHWAANSRAARCHAYKSAQREAKRQNRKALAVIIDKDTEDQAMTLEELYKKAEISEKQNKSKIYEGLATQSGALPLTADFSYRPSRRAVHFEKGSFVDFMIPHPQDPDEDIGLIRVRLQQEFNLSGIRGPLQQDQDVFACTLLYPESPVLPFIIEAGTMEGTGNLYPFTDTILVQLLTGQSTMPTDLVGVVVADAFRVHLLSRILYFSRITLFCILYVTVASMVVPTENLCWGVHRSLESM